MLDATHFLTHLGLSWILANLWDVSRKDRCLIVLAGILPDFEGITLLWSKETFLSIHRVVGHSLLSGVALTFVLALRADARWATGALALVSFHLHLVLDLVGTGGLPIQYFWPISRQGWTYPDHWVLASWQNGLVTIVTLLGVLAIAWRRGRTPIECVWPRADRRLVEGARLRAPTRG